MKFLLFLLIITSGPATSANAIEYVNKELGVAFELPDNTWKKIDQSQGVAKVIIFSPLEDMSIRCCLLCLPSAVLPEGLLTREKQLIAMANKSYERVSYKDDKLGGMDAKRLDYNVGPYLTTEYCVQEKESFLIFQLSAPTGKSLDIIKDSFRFVGELNIKTPKADSSSPAEVRKKRDAAYQQKAQKFSLNHHKIKLTVTPKTHFLKMHDKFTIESKAESLEKIELYFSVIKVQNVISEEAISWDVSENKIQNVSVLNLNFKEPLAKGAKLQIEVEAQSDEFFGSMDQNLVREISVFGQVREKSSYSSHVVYYPIDQDNDATVEMSIVVPKGYTGITGGILKKCEHKEDVSVFTYQMDGGKPRLLPLGFAVAKYEVVKGQSSSGLDLECYGYPGDENLMKQHLQAIVEAADLFEKMMGPLPNKVVRFAHVTPDKKEMGVSLPGLILISDGFYCDVSQTDLSEGDLDSREAMGLLILVDELSHQWNFYAASMPNELAEGVSTFTNALFVEKRHGKEAYRKTINYCAKHYLSGTKISRDVAIADPDIYKTDAYRVIAFCKTPVVLDMLRTKLGDELFFSAWRKAFSEFRRDQDGYRTLQNIFTKTTGVKLDTFFNQWFYMAGCPKINSSFIQNGSQVVVTVTQEKPYQLDSEVEIIGVNGEKIRKPFALLDEKTSCIFEIDFKVKSLVFDPDDLILKERG